MNEVQQKFFDFIMENVEENNKLAAIGLLTESFSKQADGSFNKEYLSSFVPKMLALLKPDSVEKVKNIMSNYKA